MGPPDRTGAELARQAFDSFIRDDYDAVQELMHPAAEWHVTLPPPDAPPGKTIYMGRDEIRGLWEQFDRTWDNVKLELESIEVEEPTPQGWIVIARTRFVGLPDEGAEQVVRSQVYLLEIDGGLLRRMRPTESVDEARFLAGLDTEPAGL